MGDSLSHLDDLLVMTVFHTPNYLGSQERNWLIPRLSVHSDLTGQTGE